MLAVLWSIFDGTMRFDLRVVVYFLKSGDIVVALIHFLVNSVYCRLQTAADVNDSHTRYWC